MATISEALAIAIQHHQAGRLPAAEQIYRQILAVVPDQVDALHLLGVIANQVGKYEIAIEYIGRAIQLKGTYAAFHSNLGNAFKGLGKLDEAVACYRQSLELNPNCAEAHNDLGNVLQSLGKLDEAVACYRRALELTPDYAEAHNNLGTAFWAVGKLDEAVDCYRRALRLRPDLAGVYNNLGNALKDQEKLDEAVGCFRRALELEPNFADAHQKLGSAVKAQGKLDEAVGCYKRALELNPDPVVHSNLLLCLHYQQDIGLAELAEAHADFQRRYAAPLRVTWKPHEDLREPERMLRLGFLSPDLGHHPVGRFLVRILENLRSHPCQTICYNDRATKDDFTERLQAAATSWQEVKGLSDQQLAERIRADRIDVLFDLAGHTAYNRLPLFARKPAPVQITWIGYEGTTGVSAIDYLLADQYVAPPELEPYCVEKVLRMPEGYVCYDAPALALPVGPLPAIEQGVVTFGSFNNLAKVTPEVVGVWAEILRRVPEARLVLKYRGLGDATVQKRYLDLFAGRGVAGERLVFWPASSYEDYLAAYQQVDIALDPFPFSGSMTTCDALWMGVPVLTCPQKTFASRHSLSHLMNVGLTEMIAGDMGEYVQIAMALASDLPRLASLRAGLRECLTSSPLCDGPRFAANLMKLLGEVWRRGGSG